MHLYGSQKKETKARRFLFCPFRAESNHLLPLVELIFNKLKAYAFWMQAAYEKNPYRWGVRWQSKPDRPVLFKNTLRGWGRL